MSIETNLAALRKQVQAASLKRGGSGDDVTLVAVSKYSAAEDVLEAARCGQRIFAENRVQQLLEKWDRLAELKAQGVEVPDLTWHLIGHLQTNKVKYIIGKVALIHSVDSVHLAGEIDKCSRKQSVVTDILLEVNVSGEASKSGIAIAEIDDFFREIQDMNHIRLMGLMTMAPKEAPEPELREIFSALYKIFIDKKRDSVHNINMTYLSMGMSADFRYAIEEGANMIRVGHGVFL